MVQYILRRLVTLMITLLGIMVVTFFISLVVPMDPLASIAGPQAPQETVERLRTLYGFDLPIYVQFGRYLNRLLQGDVGSGKTVVALLALAAVAEAGFQGALMAPTELLAKVKKLLKRK